MNAFRGLLNATAVQCIIVWAIAAIAGYAYTWLLLVAACIFLVTGYSWFAADATRRRDS